MTRDDDRPDPLPPDLHALLRRGTVDEAPGDDVRSRLMGRLGLPLVPPDGSPPDGGPGGHASGDPSVGSAGAPAALGQGAVLASSKASFGLVMFLVGSITGAAVHAGVQSVLSSPTPAAVRVVAPTLVASVSPGTPALPAASALARPPEPPTSSAPPAPAVPSSALPSVSPAPSSAPVAARPEPEVTPGPGRDAELGAERALLDMARSALARGQAAGSLTTLDQHRREFPRGRLSEEREGLAVQALVASGRMDEARTRVERFRRSYPKSLMLPALQGLVGAP